MSASQKPSKFQGLFKQAAASPLPANEPEGRIEHEEAVKFSAGSPHAPLPEPARPAQVRGAGQGASSAAERRQPGRPAGKRTDKDWKQFSVLLRHEDQFQAVSVLRSTRDKRDFSMLMQSLLEGWLKKQGQGK
jgi:hypothetical protein